MEEDGESVPGWDHGDLPNSADFAPMLASMQRYVDEHLFSAHEALVTIGKDERHALSHRRNRASRT
jgi:hypothetical protein